MQINIIDLINRIKSLLKDSSVGLFYGEENILVFEIGNERYYYFYFELLKCLPASEPKDPIGIIAKYIVSRID